MPKMTDNERMHLNVYISNHIPDHYGYVLVLIDVNDNQTMMSANMAPAEVEVLLEEVLRTIDDQATFTVHEIQRPQ